MPIDLFGRMDLQHTVIATKLHKTITVVTIITNCQNTIFHSNYFYAYFLIQQIVAHEPNAKA